MDESQAPNGENARTPEWFVPLFQKRGIQSLTTVQSLVIPHIRGGESLLFRSATGSGKTFAYLIPLIERFFSENDDTEDPRTPQGNTKRILVIAPTIELCSQIKSEAEALIGCVSGDQASAKPAPRAMLCAGQANLSRQIDTLKKENPQIIIGNPARLLELARMKKLHIDRPRYLSAVVLDEGDRLAGDEKIAPVLRELFALIPDGSNSAPPYRVQKIACQATLPEQCKKALFSLFGGEVPLLENNDLSLLRDRIAHWAVFSESRKMGKALRSLLFAIEKKGKPYKVLVFCANTAMADKITSELRYHNIKALSLHGELDKQARSSALASFRSSSPRSAVKILVSTDLASRGLDVQDITHIVSLGVPADDDSYIHRAGRTARAGKRGIAITIGDERELRALALLEKRLSIIVHPFC